MKLQVLDMTCSHCEGAIKKEILKNDKDAQILVNLKTKEVDITSKLSSSEVIQVLEEIGYNSKSLS